MTSHHGLTAFAPRATFPRTLEIAPNIAGIDALSAEDQLASERLALLVEASRILSSGRDATSATKAVLWRAVPVLADGCIFDVVGPDGQVARAWSTRAGAGSRSAHTALSHVPGSGESAIAAAVRTRGTQVRRSAETQRRAPRSVPPLLREPSSLVAVPLIVREAVAGVLTFLFSESGREHTADDVLVAEDLARRIALAMENALLRGRAREAAGAIVRERERLDALLRAQEILVEAGTLSACSFDYDATLRRIVELTVPRLADYCFIHIPDADGRPRRVAERYREPNPLADFKAPLKLPPASPIMRVMRTGASVWLRDVSDEDLVSWSQSEEHLAALRGSGPRSLVAVPLITHGRLLGTMVFAFNTSDRTYDEDAVRLAEELGQRAAWALDTALLHRAAEEAKADSVRARAEAQEANRRLDALAEASLGVFGALDAGYAPVDITALVTVVGEVVRAHAADRARSTPP
jgi:GAF domain-containing protein